MSRPQNPHFLHVFIIAPHWGHGWAQSSGTWVYFPATDLNEGGSSAWGLAGGMTCESRGSRERARELSTAP